MRFCPFFPLLLSCPLPCSALPWKETTEPCGGKLRGRALGAPHGCHSLSQATGTASAERKDSPWDLGKLPPAMPPQCQPYGAPGTPAAGPRAAAPTAAAPTAALAARARPRRRCRQPWAGRPAAGGGRRELGAAAAAEELCLLWTSLLAAPPAASASAGLGREQGH